MKGSKRYEEKQNIESRKEYVVFNDELDSKKIRVWVVRRI